MTGQAGYAAAFEELMSNVVRLRALLALVPLDESGVSRDRPPVVFQRAHFPLRVLRLGDQLTRAPGNQVATVLSGRGRGRLVVTALIVATSHASLD